MSEKHTYRFDRLHWLDYKGLLERRIIFLDLNFWIGLAEGRNSKYSELKELLTSQVAERRLVCTISPSLLLEIAKRPSSEKRTKYCQLMDELSQGLSTRTWRTIFREEFKSITEGHPVGRRIAYSHFIDAIFDDGLQILFENSWYAENAVRGSNLIFDYLKRKSICEVVEAGIDRSQEGSIAFLRNGLSQLARQEEIWRTENQSDWNSIEQSEFASSVRVLLPQIFGTVANLTSPLLSKLYTKSNEEKMDLLNQCPSFWCKYKLMTALRSNRPISENDLWDLELVAPTLPYVDCLACDKGTRHLLSEVLELDKKYGTVVLSNIDDLIRWAKRISLNVA